MGIPPYLFATSEANRSFRINKTIRKMAENEQNRTQPNPTKAKVEASGGEIDHLESASASKALRGKPKAKPTEATKRTQSLS
jgi:hypothetical protein